MPAVSISTVMIHRSLVGTKRRSSSLSTRSQDDEEVEEAKPAKQRRLNDFTGTVTSTFEAVRDALHRITWGAKAQADAAKLIADAAASGPKGDKGKKRARDGEAVVEVDFEHGDNKRRKGAVSVEHLAMDMVSPADQLLFGTVLTYLYITQEIGMDGVEYTNDAGPSTGRPIRPLPSRSIASLYNVEEAELDARHAFARNNAKRSTNCAQSTRVPYRQAEFLHAPCNRTPRSNGVRLYLRPPRELLQWRAESGKLPVRRSRVGGLIWRNIGREGEQRKRRLLNPEYRDPVPTHPDLRNPEWFGRELRQRKEERDGGYLCSGAGDEPVSDFVKAQMEVLKEEAAEWHRNYAVEKDGDEWIVVARDLEDVEWDEEAIAEAFQFHPRAATLLPPVATTSTAEPIIDDPEEHVLVTPRYSDTRGRDLGKDEDDEFEEEAAVENMIHLPEQPRYFLEPSAKRVLSMAIDKASIITDLSSNPSSGGYPYGHFEVTPQGLCQLVGNTWHVIPHAIVRAQEEEESQAPSSPPSAPPPAATPAPAPTRLPTPLKSEPTLLQVDESSGHRHGVTRTGTILQRPMTAAERHAQDVRFGRVRVVRPAPTVLDAEESATLTVNGTTREAVHIERRESYMGEEQRQRNARAREQRLMSGSRRT